MKVRYLEVIFGDNDLGTPVTDALQQLWWYAYCNNGTNLCEWSECKSMADIFVKLHKAGALKSLFERLYVLEYLMGDVEFRLRGLYLKDINWTESIVPDAGTVTYVEDYLNLGLRFHRTGTFMKKWQNGEHAYLDLQTGKVATF